MHARLVEIANQAPLRIAGMNKALSVAGSFGAITSFGSTLADRHAPPFLHVESLGPWALNPKPKSKDPELCMCGGKGSPSDMFPFERL